MSLTLNLGYDDLVRQAKGAVENLPPVLAMDIMEENEGEALIIDVRDVRELQRDGCIPNSYHVPRGLLESWADPASDYFKPVFGEGKKLFMCCASGRRSALAGHTLMQMGFDKVYNMDGGFAVWKLLDGPVSDFEAGAHVDLFDPKDQLVEL